MDLDDIVTGSESDGGSDAEDECRMLVDIALETAREECGTDAYGRALHKVVDEHQGGEQAIDELLGIMRDHTFPPGYARPRRDCDALLIELGAVGQEAQAAAEDTFGDSDGDWAIASDENRREFARAVEAAGESITDDMDMAGCVSSDEKETIADALSGLVAGLRDGEITAVRAHTDTLETFADV